MTKLIKNRLLYQLEYLKSIGLQYHEDFNYSQTNFEEINLPNNMNDLKKRVQNCYLCELSKTRKNVLFGYGNENADILFIGEEPSVTDDELGSFYGGKSGEMFLKMVENVLTLNREDIYYTNLVKCKTLNNLNNIYVDCCRHYLLKQIELINPKLIVLLGEKSYDSFFKDIGSFSQQRGEILKYGKVDIIATYSPSFLLRNPSLKKDAYYDILKIKNLMEKWN